MFTSGNDSWGRVRQMFADQFEPDGSGFIYRRSQKGEAIRVSAAERNRYIEEFDRNLSRAKWIIYLGLIPVLGGIIVFSVVRGTDLSQVAIFGGIGVAMIPYFAYYRWAWSRPASELAGRTPIAGERAPEEVQRLRFQRMTYGQLAGAAFAGLMIPFIGSSRQDAFSGWNRLWLVVGGAMVLLAAVQAFRKWRFEQEDSLSNVISRPNPATTPPDQSASSRTRPQYWRFIPLVLILLGVAFIAYTAAGKRLVQTPGFLTVVMVGIGGWALFTVVQGFRIGRIEPFVRGVHDSYERATQPKRFWASMAWNSVMGLFCLFGAFQVSGQAATQSSEDACFNRSHTYSPQAMLSACNQLIEEQPKDSDAYVERGLIFLDARKLDQAAADFSRAHELDPASPWPLANRGITYAWMNDRELAEQDFQAVRTIDPSNMIVLRGEALLNMQAGKMQAVVDGLSVELARHPDDAWSLRMRASAYDQLGDADKARADRDKLAQRRKVVILSPAS